MSLPEQNALLRRTAVANTLTEAGYPTAAATLATKATRGGGPPFRLYGRVPLYRWGEALAWAQGRLSTPRCTSKHSAATVAASGMYEIAAARTEAAQVDQLQQAYATAADCLRIL
jgi:hypothetical protein